MSRALLVAALAALFLAGCKSLTRNIFNTNMEGRAAPALQSEVWVLAEGEQAPSTGQWTVLAFFLPT